MIEIVLKGRIPSKKNSRQLFVRAGRLMSVPSKDYSDWHKQATVQLKAVPVSAEKYSRGSIARVVIDIWAPDKRSSDLTNKAESIMDLLVDYGVLEDDNWFIVNDISLHFRGVDKANPRAIVYLYTNDD